MDSPKFNEQCFLTYMMLTKPASLESTKKAGLVSKKVTAVYADNDTDATNFINRFTQTESSHELFDLTPVQISSLTPDLRVYKSYPDGREVPFIFKDHLHQSTVSSITSSGRGRGDGFGLISATVEFKGKTLFTFDKIVHVNLDFYCQDVGEIFKKPADPSKQAPFVELITAGSGLRERKKQRMVQNSATGVTVSSDQLAIAENFEIKVELGWGVPQQNKKLFTGGQLAAIREGKIILRGTLNSHNINFEQDGSVRLSAHYNSRLEGILRSEGADMFGIKRALVKKKTKIKNDLIKAQNINPIKYKKTKLKPLAEVIQDSEADLTTEVRAESYQKLLTKLDEMKKIYSLTLRKGDIAKFLSQTTATEYQSKPAPPKSRSKSKKPAVVGPYSRVKRPLEYVLLGDIVDMAFYLTKDAMKQAKTDLKPIRVFLGPFLIENPFGKGRSQACLADIPISLREFSNWFARNVITRGKSKLFVGTFIQNLIRDFAIESVSRRCFSGSPILSKITRQRIGIVQYSGDASFEDKLRKPNYSAREFSKLKWSNTLSTSSKTVDYLIFFANYVPPIAKLGIKKLDVMNGIQHLSIGKDRGLVKTMNFNKVDLAGRREQLMISGNTIFEQLREPYNASVSMVGNSLFLPGAMVFLNPSSVDLGDARNPMSAAVRLGLGGYYVVQSVSHRVTNGSYETSLDATFETWVQRESQASGFSPAQTEEDKPDDSTGQEEAPAGNDTREPVGSAATSGRPGADGTPTTTLQRFEEEAAESIPEVTNETSTREAPSSPVQTVLRTEDERAAYCRTKAMEIAMGDSVPECED